MVIVFVCLFMPLISADLDVILVYSTEKFSYYTVVIVFPAIANDAAHVAVATDLPCADVASYFSSCHLCCYPFYCCCRC